MSSNATAPDWLDTGDNAWQLAAGSLVALQSIPGLMVLYAGIVRTKWAINSAFMAFYAFAAVLISWVLWAYNMGFGYHSIYRETFAYMADPHTAGANGSPSPVSLALSSPWTMSSTEPIFPLRKSPRTFLCPQWSTFNSSSPL